MRNSIFFLFFFIVNMVMLSSCRKKIYACFKIVHPANQDSIRVGESVIVDASCSEGATEFSWDYGNYITGRGVRDTVIYNSPGADTIGLAAYVGGSSGITFKIVHVIP